MSNFKAFLKKKDITVTWQRYGIEALGAMAQGLFCSLLIGTIIKTLGTQLGVQFITDIGTYAMAVSGPAMAVAIGYALKSPPMVLFSLAAVGWAANAEGGAGGPLAVLIIAIAAAECGKAVSKETKVDLLVTPGVTILVGVALAKLIAPPIGTAANALGLLIIEATNLRPFFKINHKVQRILSDGCTFFLFQNSPDILPVLSTSMRSAAGSFGSPGIVSTSPVSATMKPAPAETLTSRTVTVKSSGAPSFVLSSEKLYCVFAMHTGMCAMPSAVSRSICAAASGRTSMFRPR